VVGVCPYSCRLGRLPQSVTQVNTTQAQVSFTRPLPALYVDLHYTGVPGVASRTSDDHNAGTWQLHRQLADHCTTLDYWFTYERNGPQFDTPHFSYTQGGGSTTPTVAAPMFSPAGGVYATSQTVTLSDATAGSTIRYTVDGSQPTATSTHYSGPIAVPTSANHQRHRHPRRHDELAGCPARRTRSAPGRLRQPDVPNFGPNVRIFDPGMSAATIQGQLDADFNAQKDTLSAQFGRRRVAHLFKPAPTA